MRRVLGIGVAVVACCAIARANEEPADEPRDDPPTTYLGRLAAVVRSRLSDAVAARGPKITPPVPIKPKWRASRIGWLDVGSPVVAAVAADLDGDGKAELYLVTPHDVIAVSLEHKVKELGRVAFHGEPAVPASRDVVATAVVQGTAVIAAVSGYAKDMKVTWKGHNLVGKHGPGGFSVCGERLQLSEGRNHFRDGPNAIFGAVCRDDLKDAAGYPLHARAELATSGVVTVTVEKCAPNGTACQPAGSYEYKDVGTAFDIADVDRDGTPELIASSASPPGDLDTLRVITLGTPANKPLFKSKPYAQGFAAVAVADIDGDGVAEVIAVVRFTGATKAELWRFD